MIHYRTHSAGEAHYIFLYMSTHVIVKLSFWNFSVEKYLFLNTMVVREEYRGCALSYDMIKAVTKETKQLGITVISAMCTSFYSQRIFEKLGYETVFEIKYEGNYDLYEEIPSIHSTARFVVKRLDE